MSICKKCGGTLISYYGAVCPLCDKPEETTKRILNFFRIAFYIAAHEKYALNTWPDKVLRGLEFPGNDCYIEWYIGAEGEYDYSEEICQFNSGLAKYFGVKSSDTILLNISW